MPGRYLVGLRVRNTLNGQDKMVGTIFRRREQFKPDVVWAVFRKVIRSNVRFGLTDRLDVHLDHFQMPACKCKMAEKKKGRV